MADIRKNVWSLGGDWAEPILWYARGVKVMKSRSMDNRLSWRFFAGIHDYDQSIWSALGQLAGPQPSDADVATYWRQCQHGNWYFLPWHRGYLVAFEAAIRDAIKSLPGAPKDWTLPYWNYFLPGQNKLPPAFASPSWPDNDGPNPLFVVERWGSPKHLDDVPLKQIEEDALSDPDFVGIGSTSGGGTGFGGPKLGFLNRGKRHGGIETQPHDFVHGLVGGSSGTTDGLMSSPVTAPLDPIFWLHHANIDRLWEVWTRQPTAKGNPTDSAWLDGPASNGERAFVMPMPSQAKPWAYTPRDVNTLEQVGYTYDDLTTKASAHTLAERVMLLRAATPAAKDAPVIESANAADVELLGANGGPIMVAGTSAHTQVTMAPSVEKRTLASLQLAGPKGLPDRVFLNLENVRGKLDSTILDVYVNLPDGSDPDQHPELRAGSVSFFGVRAVSTPDGPHQDEGMTFVLEITRVMDRLHIARALDPGHLDIRLTPLAPVPEAAQVTIGRISVFRQGL